MSEKDETPRTRYLFGGWGPLVETASLPDWLRELMPPDYDAPPEDEEE